MAILRRNLKLKKKIFYFPSFCYLSCITDENELETTRSISPHTSSSHNSLSITTNSQSIKNINQPIDLLSNVDAISRAKNTIAFCRALNGGYFRNMDPRHFAVILDGQLIGIYENESKACQAAVAAIKGDGMVFPISGNFKSKKDVIYL